MSSSDEPEQPRRLSAAAEPYEQRLLRSAKLDVASRGARERAFQAAAAALGRRARWSRPKRAAVVLATAALAAAAAVALFVRRQPGPPPALSAEPAPLPAQTRAAPAPPIAPPPAVPTQAPARPPCARLVTAAGADPLIDDFEDQNARIAIREGRSGFWTVNGDPKSKQTPRAGQTAFPLRIPDGRDGSAFGLRLRGGAQPNPGTGLTFGFAPGRCYDASAYDGVEFWARGKSRIYVRFTMIDVMAVQFGGLCRKNCYDAHAAPVDLSPEWTLHRVRWQDLEQGGWGPPEAFDPRRLLNMEFGVLTADMPFDFWIDDLSFLRR